MRDRMRSRYRLRMACLAVITACASGIASGITSGIAGAQTLTVGLQIETTSIDPHFSTGNPSVSAARHLFDTLVHPDEQQHWHPGLALSWSAVSATEWEFRLRPGVRFHDGSAFTAEDVAFSLARAPDVPNAPSGFGVFTKQITGITVVDPMTIRLRTDRAFPLMAEHLSAVGIVSRAANQGMQTQDYNTGKAAIGTGPFRFVSWTPGDRLRLARNDIYWGRAPAWQEVVLRPISDDGARVAALLSGTVDVIDLVPTTAVRMLREKSSVTLAQTVTSRVIFVGVNVNPAPNPFVTDTAGAPLANNPFVDRRVRLAISKAINRRALTEQVMEGLAMPAGQLLPDGYPGTSPRLQPEPYDQAAARILLAEAGYPRGFNLTLLVPRDRNASDVKIAEALAQMLARIGVHTTLEALPWSIAQPRYRRGEFALSLRGWGTETGEGSMALRSLLGTRDAARGWGMTNGGFYANPAMDALLDQALSTLDATQREALVAQATELGMRDVGLIPLHYQVAIWGMRKGLTYKARSDSYTFAFEIRPTPAP